MRNLTLKQEKFTKAYLDTGNATEAATRAYKPKKRATARAIGSENLTKPNIRAYLEERAGDAVAMVYTLSQKAKNEAVRFNASRDILDRVGYFVDKNRPVEAKQPMIIHFSGAMAEKHGINTGIPCPPDCIEGKPTEELEKILARDV